jgi:hypothetical protein
MLLSHILPLTYQAQQQKSRAKDQMNFQREMSNTAYQRSMSDMRKSGLNPILASKLGGASTPSGAMAQVPDFGKAMSEMGPQALQMAMGKAQIQQTSANVQNVLATTAKIREETAILKRTGGSVLGKTGLGIDRLLDDASKSKVGKFVTGKSLTEMMEGTAIDKVIRDFINDITNAKEASTDKPLRIRIPRRVPKYYINRTRTK